MPWYLLTSRNPKVSELRLQSENNERRKTNQPPLRFFVPYQFLQHQQPDRLSPTTDPKANGEHSNEIRAALHRYIFVCGEEDDLAATLRQPWNIAEQRLQFFHNREGCRVTIPDEEMDIFMRACADERLNFEIFPSLDDIEIGEEVRLITTPFSGRNVKILDKRHTSKGTRLTVEVQLFNSPISVRLYDIKDEDLQYTKVDDRKQQSRDSKLVTGFQRQLIDILSRRINDKDTPESRLADAAALDNIYHFHGHQFTSAPLRRRFLAMMLICAHLRHDAETITPLLHAVQQELDLLDARPESRAATDVRAYLHLALYLATANHQYRTAAKQYVREHAPKSEDLRRLLSLLTRREATRILNKKS